MTRNSLEPFERLESNVRSYSRCFPAVFTTASGAEVMDEAGKSRVDFFCGAGSMNYGHNPAALTEAVIAYLRSGGLLHGLDTATVPKREFLETFEQTILRPRAMKHRVQFTSPAGTDAVEAALKLARKTTGRVPVVAFTGAYHGVSTGALAAMGSRKHRAAAGMPLHNIHRVPYPEGPSGSFDTLGYLKMMLDDHMSGFDLPAAVLIECVQMEGGVYAASSEFLRGLRELCTARGIFLIADEIQVGCGRTGPFFSFEPSGIVPDIITLSKSIGSGFPMAMCLIREDLDKWGPGEHCGTFRGPQLSFVAARATLEYWKDDKLQRGTAASAELVRAWHAERRGKPGWPGLRGTGLGLGLDFAPVGGGARSEAIATKAFDLGVIAETCGRNDEVLKLMPPLTIPADVLRRGLDVIEAAIAAVPA